MEQDNNTYYQRPGQSTGSSHISKKKTEPPNTFAKAAMILGGISLVSVFTFTIIPAVIFGALALILALLSRGKSLKFHSKAKSAIILASLAFVVNIAFIGGTFSMIFGDNPYHDQLNATYEELIGMSYDEFLEGAMDGSIDAEELNEIYEQIFEQMYEGY